MIGTGAGARLLSSLTVPLVAVVGSIAITALVLLAFGADPVEVFATIFTDSFATSYGLSETLVKATPILLCALAVAVPAWAGLMNVGAEGQLYIGAVCATGVALYAPQFPAFAMLPLMLVAAFVGGSAWAGVAAILRVRFNTSEIMVTLLGNFLAVLLVSYLVYGPWRDGDSRGWPQSAAFAANAVLPDLGLGRVHLGLAIAIGVAIALFVLRARTPWGLQMRVVQSSKETAAYAGIPVERYLLWSLIVGGGIAALAGAAEVSAIQGRLRADLSLGYGYTGILVSWLARHNPLAIIVASFFVGGLLAGGDGVQITMGLPAATIGIAVGSMLFFLLLGDVLVDRLRRGRS